MKKSNDKAAFLGSITASVTHEIQNVLAIIKETSGLMEDFLKMNQAQDLSDLEERLNGCIETIKRQAYRGVALTSGLNGFAHTSDNAQDSINIYKTIEKMISIASRLFVQKGFSVSIIQSNKKDLIVTDPILFQMIIFLCIECLIDTFQTKAAITIDIQSIENRSAIKFLYVNTDLRYKDCEQQVMQDDHWIKICDLSTHLGISAKAYADSPGILLLFK